MPNDPQAPRTRAAMAEAYNALGFPPVTDAKGWLYGVWFCGARFPKQRDEGIERSENYYGSYPFGLVRRIRAMLGPCQLLHLCCGTARIVGAVNVDIKPTSAADVVADAEALPFAPGIFDAVLIDPPYSTEDASRYGNARLVSYVGVMREAARCLKSGGLLLWLDERMPQYERASGWRIEGAICVLTGFQRRARVLSIWRWTGTWQTRMPFRRATNHDMAWEVA